VKIDKASLSQTNGHRRRSQHIAQGPQGNSRDPTEPAATTPTGSSLEEIENAGDAPERSASLLPQVRERSLESQVLAAFITLLILAFGAGILIARLTMSPSQPAFAPLSPMSPTAIPPTPTSPATATATSPDSGDLLDTLYIDVAPGDMTKIAAKRDEALELGVLLASGSDYVPGTVRVGRDEIPVELRLKGDWVDHIAHDKWSFRVRTLGENYVKGMRVFSLQSPSTRTYLDEWLFLQNIRQEGVLAPHYSFIRVVLNGEHKGIYALEEGFSKELLESQQRREGPIIRYDEDLVWEYRAFYDDQVIPTAVDRFFIIDEFQTGHIESDPTLRSQRDAAVGMLRALWTGDRTAVEVFDLDAMGDFLALTDLWNAVHGLIWHNLRYYYNPITARLEPIAFDADALAGRNETLGLPQSAFYSDPALQAAYVQSLWRISGPGYVEALEKQLGAQYERLRAEMEPEFGADALEPPWDLLRRRQQLLRQMLKPHQTVYAYVQQNSSESVTLIDVGNLLELPLEIVGIAVNGTMLPVNSDWVAPDSAEFLFPTSPEEADALILRPLPPDAMSMSYVHLQIPSSALPVADPETQNVEIVTRLWGLTERHSDTALPGYPAPLAEGPIPARPSVAEALAQHPYLKAISDEMMLQIDSGVWDVNGNLILPLDYGLRVMPGTTLRFGRDNYLLASGPLDFRGTEDAPIVLQPAPTDNLVGTQARAGENQKGGDEWQGVVVLNANSPSIWDYVTVENASAVEQNGWSLTGGVTFHESPIHLDHSRIRDSRGEDGMNIIRSKFDIARSEFGGGVSDALDLDFAQGTIRDCSFHDMGGDGIDASGSDVDVERVKLLNIADKGISVGEASQLTAREVQMENVGLGAVSKDLSSVTIDDATIVNAGTAGLAAYIKKPAYGPATLSARDIRFVEMPPERYTLVQTGSWIELDGRHIEGTDVDVDALYQP
jgi:hypothetical protein